MPGLPSEPKIILEPYKKGDGRKCNNCRKIIQGMMYAGVIQFRETKFDNMQALNLFVCEKCKKEFESNRIWRFTTVPARNTGAMNYTEKKIIERKNIPTACLIMPDV